MSLMVAFQPEPEEDDKARRVVSVERFDRRRNPVEGYVCAKPGSDSGNQLEVEVARVPEGEPGYPED